MARLGGDVPCFDELLDSAQPKDTEVVIVEEEEDSSDDEAEQHEKGRKRSRPKASQRSITLTAHWVVLFSLSPYFQTKVCLVAGIPQSNGCTTCRCTVIGAA
jgi:hypothetical protein